VDNFFASHPLEESRVTHTRALIDAYDRSSLANLKADDASFREFKALVATLPPPPAPQAVP
jgi:hypothetical protein